MVNAAAVVYVFVEDSDTTISVEDLKEWLQMIDEVIEIKLQYDATSKRTCHAVEFRKSNSAQQAVQYLNGARFKNCIVSIKSRVFSVAEEEPSSTSARSSSAAALPNRALATRKRTKETAELPFNHLLPPDLQMDQLLVEQLPEAAAAEGFTDVAALWKRLKGTQERLAATYAELDKTKADLTAADALLRKLLHVNNGAGAGDSSSGSNANDGGSGDYALGACRCVSHQRGIAIDANTTSSVVGFVTASFGPLAFCAVTQTHQEFFLVLKFVFAADETSFLSSCADGGGGGSSSRGKDGKTTAARSEKERELLSLQWSAIDFSITARDFTSQALCDEARQRAVRELLQ